MAGEDRRKKILQLLKGQILNGSQLAKQLNVSRQVIVQDIALLRTSGSEILSTRQGYILSADNTCTRTYHVRCPESEIEPMLNVFVDAGGTVQDIFVIHNTYGVIRAELHLCNRREVKQFIESIHTGREAALHGRPLAHCFRRHGKRPGSHRPGTACPGLSDRTNRRQ